MASYNFNKGIDAEVEFKGLKSQYLLIFAGGLIGVFVLFVILYMIGVNQWACIILGIVLASALVYYTFKLNARYGSHGLMKAGARKKFPRRIINRKRIGRMIGVNRSFTVNETES